MFYVSIIWYILIDGCFALGFANVATKLYPIALAATVSVRACRCPGGSPPPPVDLNAIYVRQARCYARKTT